jgi:hypothetical protein
VRYAKRLLKTPLIELELLLVDSLGISVTVACLEPVIEASGNKGCSVWRYRHRTNTKRSD